MITLIGTTAAIFTVAVVAHWGLTHLSHNRLYVRNAFLLFGAVCLAALPIAVRFGPIGFLIVYSALVILWNSYLVFFINLINSVSLRIIDEIDRSPNQSLSLSEVENAYSDKEALELRLKALAMNGLFIDEGAKGLTLTPKGTMFARGLELARKVFGIDSFG